MKSLLNCHGSSESSVVFGSSSRRYGRGPAKASDVGAHQAGSPRFSREPVSSLHASDEHVGFTKWPEWL